MKMRKTLLAAALGLLTASSAHAALWSGDFNTGDTHDGVVMSINGFDVYSNGSVAFWNLTTGLQVDPLSTTGLSVGDSIQVYYQGIVNSFAPGATAPNLAFPGNTGTYQLTVAATFTEVVSFIGTGVAIISPLSSGRVSMFYDDDTTTFANIAAGTGYTDGMVILDGSVSGFPTSAVTTFTIFSGGGSGVATIAGPVSSAAIGSVAPDTVGFMPDSPDGFISTTTLQVGPGINTDYQTDNFFDNANGWNSVAVNKDLTLRGDANIDLTRAVPEPATLALVGLGLLGLGASLRRRKAA